MQSLHIVSQELEDERTHALAPSTSDAGISKSRANYCLGADDTLEPFGERAPPWLMRLVWGGGLAIGVAFWAGIYAWVF